MAYADIQNKVGQIQMANRVLLAQAMSDEEKFKKKKELKKQVRKTPKQRQSEARGKDPKFQGGSPGTVFVPPDGPTTDQDIQDALQDEDMRQGDYLQDPEQLRLPLGRGHHVGEDVGVRQREFEIFFQNFQNLRRIRF